MTTPPSANPGWYPDPDGSNTMRYWNGSEWTEPPAKAKKTPSMPKKPLSLGQMGCIGVIIVVLLVATVGAIIGNLKDAGDGSESTATVLCEQEVRSHLKAPSTAKFAHSTASGAGPWKIRGSVDSENSFGAMLRADFTCTVTHTSGDEYRVRIDSLG